MAKTVFSAGANLLGPFGGVGGNAGAGLRAAAGASSAINALLGVFEATMKGMDYNDPAHITAVKDALFRECDRVLDLNSCYFRDEITLSWPDTVRVVVMIEKPSGETEFQLYKAMCKTGAVANRCRPYVVPRDFDLQWTSNTSSSQPRSRL